jgi:hypothetical protein
VHKLTLDYRKINFLIAPKGYETVLFDKTTTLFTHWSTPFTKPNVRFTECQYFVKMIEILLPWIKGKNTVYKQIFKCDEK